MRRDILNIVDMTDLMDFIEERIINVFSFLIIFIFHPSSEKERENIIADNVCIVHCKIHKIPYILNK